MDVSGEEEADTTRDSSSSHAWSGSILFVIPPMATQPDSNHSPKSLREEKNNKKKGGWRVGGGEGGLGPGHLQPCRRRSSDGYARQEIIMLFTVHRAQYGFQHRNSAIKPKRRHWK